MVNSIDRIIWELVPQNNSIQKKALKRAIKKIGSAKELSVKMGISRQIVSRWVNKICLKGRRLMHPDSAKRIEKIAKIKGLAEEISRKYRR